MATPRTVTGRLSSAAAQSRIAGLPLRFVEIVAVVLGASLVALVVSSAEPSLVLLGAGAAVLFLIAFLSPDTGLYILVFSMLLSPEFIVGDLVGQTAQGRGVTFRLEDFLIILIGVAWLRLSPQQLGSQLPRRGLTARSKLVELAGQFACAHLMQELD